MQLEKMIFFTIEYFSLDEMLNSTTTNLQMAAGGNHNLMFMEQANAEQIWGTSLCDFDSVQNDYLCKGCLPGWFSAGFNKLKCTPCETLSDYYGQMT